MPATGTVLAQIYTSDALIPLQGATLTIFRTLPDGVQELMRVQLSNFDGYTSPVSIQTPELAESQQYQSGSRPYTVLTLRVDCPGYTSILVQGVQVFSGVQTLQPFQLIPTPSLLGGYPEAQRIQVPPQDL